SRFIFMSVKEVNTPSSFDELDIYSRWILTLLDRLIEEVTASYDDYDFNRLSQLLYNFFWDDFCDWYIEIAKLLLRDGSRYVGWVLITVLKNYLKLIHPIMPFITEELWSYMEEGFLSTSSWPERILFRDEENTKSVELIYSVIRSLRSIKQEIGIPFEKKVEGFVYSQDHYELLYKNREIISSLAKIEPLNVIPYVLPHKKGIVTSVHPEFEVYLQPEGFHFEEEIERLEKRILEVDEQILKVEKRLQDEEFLLKAKEEAKEKERLKRENLLKEKEKLLYRLSLLSSS
ncbi:MAG: class I tRNA ligase family protein, partial [bacterium]